MVWPTLGSRTAEDQISRLLGNEKVVSFLLLCHYMMKKDYRLHVCLSDHTHISETGRRISSLSVSSVCRFFVRQFRRMAAHFPAVSC